MQIPPEQQRHFGQNEQRMLEQMAEIERARRANEQALKELNSKIDEDLQNRGWFDKAIERLPWRASTWLLILPVLFVMGSCAVAGGVQAFGPSPLRRKRERFYGFVLLCCMLLGGVVLVLWSFRS
jgi:hypothetical protein